jgi:hypothetical protein
MQLSRAPNDHTTPVQAAENTELPCKALVLKDNAPAAERKSLLDKFCIDPCHEIKTIYKEFRDFVAFMEQDSRKMVCGVVSL